MDIRQLRSFVSVVECNSISRAAIELGATQQAISQQIANLEEELGISLLIRGAKGVTPRDTGRVLFEHARAILRQLEQASAEVKHLHTNPVGEVRLGLPASTTEMLSVPLLQEIESHHPGIVLHIATGLSTYIIPFVRSGWIDLAVLAPAGDPEGLDIEELVTEDLFLVGPPRKSRKITDVQFAELAKIPLILPARPHNDRVVLEESAVRAGFHLKIKRDIEGLPLIKALVRAGYGQTVLTWAAMHEEWGRGELSASRLVNPSVTRTLCLVTRADRPSSRAALEVRRILRDKVMGSVDSGLWRATVPTPVQVNQT